MVKHHALPTRYRAVVMPVNGGLTQVQIRQAGEDLAENPQTFDGPRSLRRGAGKSHGRGTKVVMSRVAKNCRGEVCAEAY